MYTSLASINSKDECDQLIAVATKDKQQLLYKKDGLVIRYENASQRAAEIADQLKALNIQLSVYDLMLADLPDPELRKDTLLKQEYARHKKYVLLDRQKDLDAVSRLQTEYEISGLERQIEESEAFIEEVVGRKNEM